MHERKDATTMSTTSCISRSLRLLLEVHPLLHYLMSTLNIHLHLLLLPPNPFGSMAVLHLHHLSEQELPQGHHLQPLWAFLLHHHLGKHNLVSYSPKIELNYEPWFL